MHVHNGWPFFPQVQLLSKRVFVGEWSWHRHGLPPETGAQILPCNHPQKARNRSEVDTEWTCCWNWSDANSTAQQSKTVCDSRITWELALHIERGVLAVLWWILRWFSLNQSSSEFSFGEFLIHGSTKLCAFRILSLVISAELERKFVFISATNDDLFTVEAMHDLCHFEHQHLQPYLGLHTKNCTLKNGTRRPTERKLRCRSHSLPLYTMLLTGKQSCSSIDESDIRTVKNLLAKCFPLYKKGHLSQKTHEHSPKFQDCYRDGLVFKIFHYIVDSSFMQIAEGHVVVRKLQHTLMVVQSSHNSTGFIDYFKAVFHDKNPVFGSVQMVGFFQTLGMKLRLFASYISDELWLFGLAASFILLIELLYLQSVVILLATLLNIIFSFNMTYMCYHVIFGIEFFPFMNLLAAVVIIAIAADDVFIFCDTWNKIKRDICGNKREITEQELPVLVCLTFKHATAAIMVTSFTTAAAFYANCVSNITAVKCFGIFSGTIILANFLLMVTWTPSAVILVEKMSLKLSKKSTCKESSVLKQTAELFHRFERKMFKVIFPAVVREGWFILILVFAFLSVSGFVLIFYWPKLHLPQTKYIRMFVRGPATMIERYETDLEKYFEFARKDYDSGEMKIQFVWGMQPKDNGGVFDADPTKGATLLPVPSFNMTSIEAQLWLIKSCHSMMSQDFFVNSTCMFDFYSEMLRTKCSDPKYGAFLQPCCDIESFPVEPSKLERCLPILDGMAYVLMTQKSRQRNYDFISIGMCGRPIFDGTTNLPRAFFMNVRTKVTMTTSYPDNKQKFAKLDEFASSLLTTAPPELTPGWWGSYPDLMLYDLQMALEFGVIISIAVSLAVTLPMMLLTSLNFIVTIVAGVTIIFVISATLGALVLCGWELNIIESITLSLAVGLSIDFTIHYGVAFKMSDKNFAKDKVTDSLSKVGSAVAMAALTTFAAGLAMMPTRIISYYELGTFLMVVMTFSWCFSTFFFLSICCVTGSLSNFCQISCSSLKGASSALRGLCRGWQTPRDNQLLCSPRTGGDDILLDDPYNGVEFTDQDDVPILMWFAALCSQLKLAAEQPLVFGSFHIIQHAQPITVCFVRGTTTHIFILSWQRQLRWPPNFTQDISNLHPTIHIINDTTWLHFPVFRLELKQIHTRCPIPKHSFSHQLKCWQTRQVNKQ